MAKTMKIPQQRAVETRRRIVDAAYQVFARRGYGQATVDEIGNEAGVSMGALYHHFASKEELFRAILDEHMREEELQLGVLLPATTFRETLERFIAFWLDHLETKHTSDPLFMELWAQATREPWAREAVVAFFRRGIDLLKDALRLAQDAGVIRQDLDVEAAATLVYATMEGVAVLWAVDSEGTDLSRLQAPWVDLIERFVASDSPVDVPDFQKRLAALFEERQAQDAAESGRADS